MGRTNIERQLKKNRSTSRIEKEILEEVHSILLANEKERSHISNRLKSPKGIAGNAFVFDLLETDKIYHIDTIKQICIDYRLRFLDSKYFKGNIPESAITKINAIEKAHNATIEGFKLMAPSKLFKLEDKDDPLLFAPIGNGYFYLIHKWGSDLHPLRKLLVWPFKNLVNLVVTTLFISLITTFFVPNGLFYKKGGTAEFWMIFFFMFKWIAAVVLYYAFAKGKNFNYAIWNSKYFNA